MRNIGNHLALRNKYFQKFLLCSRNPEFPQKSRAFSAILIAKNRLLVGRDSRRVAKTPRAARHPNDTEGVEALSPGLAESARPTLGTTLYNHFHFAPSAASAASISGESHLTFSIISLRKAKLKKSVRASRSLQQNRPIKLLTRIRAICYSEVSLKWIIRADRHPIAQVRRNLDRVTMTVIAAERQSQPVIHRRNLPKRIHVKQRQQLTWNDFHRFVSNTVCCGIR